MQTLKQVLLSNELIHQHPSANYCTTEIREVTEIDKKPRNGVKKITINNFLNNDQNINYSNRNFTTNHMDSKTQLEMEALALNKEILNR